MLLCTTQEEPKHPCLPTFDHVNGGGIKICLIRTKCPEIQELLPFWGFQAGVSPSAWRAMT